MKIVPADVFAITNPDGDVPVSTKLIVTTIASWFDTVLPYVQDCEQRENMFFNDSRILKIYVGRQLGHSYVLSAMANLYGQEMVILMQHARFSKIYDFPKAKTIGLNIFVSRDYNNGSSIKRMLQDSSLKGRVLFCDHSFEALSYKTKREIMKFGFKAIVSMGL